MPFCGYLHRGFESQLDLPSGSNPLEISMAVDILRGTGKQLWVGWPSVRKEAKKNILSSVSGQSQPCVENSLCLRALSGPVAHQPGHHIHNLCGYSRLSWVFLSSKRSMPPQRQQTMCTPLAVFCTSAISTTVNFSLIVNVNGWHFLLTVTSGLAKFFPRNRRVLDMAAETIVRRSPRQCRRHGDLNHHKGHPKHC